MWSEGHAISRVSYPQHKPSPYQIWLSYSLRKRRYCFFDLWRNLTWSRDKKVMRLHACFFFIISYHLAKFCGHRPWIRGDILFFVCHVTSCDHMAGESCDIMGEFPFLYFTILKNLVVKILQLQSYNSTSSDFMIRESHGTMSEFLLS